MYIGCLGGIYTPVYVSQLEHLLSVCLGSLDLRIFNLKGKINNVEVNIEQELWLTLFCQTHAQAAISEIH